METETRSPIPGASDRDLQVGQKVGEYVVEAKIGEGGFGTVFRATHPLIGKVAAVKVLNRQYSADPEMVSRFVAEARAVNQIRHRNIIDIFAFGQIEDGRSYYVMEFLDGEPLDEHIKKHGAIPLGEAIPILRATARALDAAHAKGIAHRDLKPENIFLARESDGSVYPKLLDFGIAKLLGAAGAGQALHKTRTGAPIGTPYYMSPEQCRGRDVDHRTDIYAFGVVAYKLLTREVPFEGEDYMEILLKQIGEEPVPPSTRNPALPASVDDAIAWMMKKDPAARPPNLITAMRALEEAAVAAGVEVRTDQTTGLHATQTSRVAAQRTPSNITPIPRAAAGTPGPSQLGSAATVDASVLSDAMDSVRGVTAETAAKPAMTTFDGAPPRRSPAMLIAALVGACAIGAVVFFVIRSSKDTPAEPPAATATSGGVAPSDPPADREQGAGGPGSAAGAGRAADVRPDVGVERLVAISIEGPPAGTEVYGPRGLLGVAPGVVQLPRDEQDVILTFKAEGHVATSRTVKPTEDMTLEVALDKKEPQVAVDPDDGKGGGKTGGKAGAGKTGAGKTSGGKTGGGKDAGGKDGGGKTGGGSGSGAGSGSNRDALEDPFGTGGT